MPVKPKGVVLAEFVAEEKTVMARYKNDHSEWIAIATLRTAKQAQHLAGQLNQLLGVIKNG